jgi:predicted NAD/FAD-dependent oxidoreductase
MAARKLTEAGLSVLILDKGRGSGGRLATRRVSEKEDPEGRVDYGAPLMTVETPLMQSLANDWERDGVIRVWPDDASNLIGNKYIGRDGMRGIARYLAKDLDIRQSEKVVQLEPKSYWRVTTEAGNLYQSRILFLTAPLPQALLLLDENKIKLEQSDRDRLDQVEYDPCLALFGVLAGPSKLLPPGALFMENGPIRWIADHQRRKISGIPTFTAHLSPTFSHQSWELPDEQIISKILPEITALLGTKPQTIRIHRWKYASARNTYSQPFYLQKKSLPLILAGDGFVAGGIEGAVISGITAAEAVKKHFGT